MKERRIRNESNLVPLKKSWASRFTVKEQLVSSCSEDGGSSDRHSKIEADG